MFLYQKLLLNPDVSGKSSISLPSMNSAIPSQAVQVCFTHQLSALRTANSCWLQVNGDSAQLQMPQSWVSCLNTVDPSFPLGWFLSMRLET